MKKIPPPAIVLLGIALQCLVNKYAPVYDYGSYVSTASGIVIIIVAVLLASVSVAIFRKSKTTVVPHGKPSKLVAVGPYKFTRNPMYLSLLLVLMGSSFIFGTVSVLAIPLIFMLIIDSQVIPMEEKTLRHKFGKQYDSYAKKVRRWL